MLTLGIEQSGNCKRPPGKKNRQRASPTFRHRLQRYIRDFVTLVTMIMIYDLFDIDMPFELVGVSRSTELVLRFNSAGHMWESEMLPVECIMV
jgi:hypothetical protein